MDRNGNATNDRYPILFSPIDLGSVRIANRVAMAPMGNCLNDARGFVTPDLIAYLEERAKGGVGLIFSPFAVVSPGHPSFGAYCNEMIDGLRELASRIRAHGVALYLQIAHMGANHPGDPMGPTGMETRFYHEGKPRTMTIGDIDTTIAQFANAAHRAKVSGFSGVELHGGLAYLVGSFCSPYLNRRQDEYGGLEGGLRYVERIIAAIRDRCGDFPLGFKMNGHEHVEGGLDDAMVKRIATTVESFGVDFLHVVAASSSATRCEFCGVSTTYRTTHHLARGVMASRIKEQVGIPVITDGGILDPADAEDLLSRGWADVVSVGRALIADPDWVKYAARGDAYRPCVRCNVCHTRQIKEKKPVRCSVNPLAGRERLSMEPAAKSLEVVVIGGGPAGMQAALTASQRGHIVRLYERDPWLGGKMRQASRPSFKRPLRAYLEYLIQEIEASSVMIELERAIGASDLVALGFDAVILATGSRPIEPDIPGLTDAEMIYAADLLEDPAWVGATDRVLILGANKVGCEAAWFIREETGRPPTLIDVRPFEELLVDEYARDRVDLLCALREMGIPVLCGRTPIAAKREALLLRREAGGEEAVDFDKIVIATGARAEDSLAKALQNWGEKKNVVSVGDCVEPRTIFYALQEGFSSAYSLGTE